MTMRSWPGESNGDGNESGAGSVGTPDQCPFCGDDEFEQLPSHLRNNCSGTGTEIVTDGGRELDFDVEGTRANGSCRVCVQLGDEEILGEGSTPELALRNAADEIEIMRGGDGS